MSAVRYTGLSLSDGEFIALLYSDDAWLPWKLDPQLVVVARSSEADTVWIDMYAPRPDGQRTATRHLRTTRDAQKYLTQWPSLKFRVILYDCVLADTQETTYRLA